MDRIKEFIQDILENNVKRYIAIGIISSLTLTIFIIIIVVIAGKSGSSEKVVIEYISPNCSEYCSNPYDKVYSDKAITSKLVIDCK